MYMCIYNGLYLQPDLSVANVPPFSTPTVEGGGGAAGGAGAVGAAGAATGAWLGKQCHAQVKEDMLFLICFGNMHYAEQPRKFQHVDNRSFLPSKVR